MKLLTCLFHRYKVKWKIDLLGHFTSCKILQYTPLFISNRWARYFVWELYCLKSLKNSAVFEVGDNERKLCCSEKQPISVQNSNSKTYSNIIHCKTPKRVLSDKSSNICIVLRHNSIRWLLHLTFLSTQRECYLLHLFIKS